MEDDLEARLAATAEAVREREGAGQRAEVMRQRILEMDQHLAALRADHAAGLDEVDRLEGLSVARVMASLSGARDDHLARERAEAEAAALRLEDAQARLVALWREHDAAEVTWRALDWAPDRFTALLEEKERRLRSSGDLRLPRICELAEERGRLVAEAHELGEALHAAAIAERAVLRAQARIERAHRWIGVHSHTAMWTRIDPMKLHLINDAAAGAAEADRCVIALRTELADVGGVGGVGLPAPQVAVDGLARWSAPWVDFLTTSIEDAALRGRMDRIHQSLGAGLAELRELAARLEQRAATTRARLAQVDTERHALIAG